MEIKSLFGKINFKMATTRNIQMQYFNGTDYDTLYPQANYQNMTGTKPSYSYSELTGTKPSYSYSEITGTIPSSDLPTIPINKGGTGQATATNGLGALVNGSTTTSSLSTSYYVGLSTGSSGRKATLATLGNWIQNNYGNSGGAQIASISYNGTGVDDYEIVFPNITNYKLQLVFIVEFSNLGDYLYGMPIIKPANGREAYYNTIRKRDGELSFTSRHGSFNFINNYTLEVPIEFNENGNQYNAVGIYGSI